MRIFMTGATGFVGSHLRKALVAEQHQVTALTRRPQPEEPGVCWVTGDLQLRKTLLAGMLDCQAVIHLAGLLRAKETATFLRVHVEGTAQVLNVMRQLGVARLLHMSALGAGANQPTEYFRTKWAAERVGARQRTMPYDFSTFAHFRPRFRLHPPAGCAIARLSHAADYRQRRISFCPHLNPCRVRGFHSVFATGQRCRGKDV